MTKGTGNNMVKGTRNSMLIAQGAAWQGNNIWKEEHCMINVKTGERWQHEKRNGIWKRQHDKCKSRRKMAA